MVAAGKALNTKQRKARGVEDEGGVEKSTKAIGLEIDGGFVCERVCISKRLQNKIGCGGDGELSKDPSAAVDGCVTVCGFGEIGARCVDACARTVCAHQHQLSNWNTLCLGRCQSECLKLSNSVGDCTVGRSQ